MRYLLINRFKGALLGALLGEVLAKDAKAEYGISSDTSQIAVLGTKSLIELGKLDIDNWLKSDQTKSLQDRTDGVLRKVMIATLPVALFFHENRTTLRQNLLCMLQIWGDDPVMRDCTLAVGYAIAQCLTENISPRTLIPEIIAFIGETPTLLPQKLLELNDLLAKGVGLETAQAAFNRPEEPTHAIAMAFYCFLSTLEDLHLAVLRATHKHNTRREETDNLDSQIISLITGALSGAYNSTAGIPLKWQLLLCSANLDTGERRNFSKVLELADALVAVWSGVYDPALHLKDYSEEGCAKCAEQDTLPVFASPRVIQSR
ncbi:ADP-ribosylglycohydrolase family protein [Nodularia harveyana UHCC-0300]|uniref:ADP-ribosylglycohydrolase family protein n=1 Tax=Nodularia harveyana UHCC-0300 TaxID=2974287 RepID=A0ABU5UIN9_9CYAN|nr:ADP-ribosylglycohydrolase family protein [Nodularia harveyana]MEA5583375.1 ADP-ribosylglycohydrolase family protein [Nodularia harveyana UHCC-0300]